MKDPISVNPIRSKLGREIYALAAILASLPIVIIGTISVIQIESHHRAQAFEGLEQLVRTYGELVFERLSSAADLAAHRAQSPPTTSAARTHFEAFAVYAGTGERVAGTLDIDIDELATAAANTETRARLLIDDSTSPPTLTVWRAISGNRFVGRLSSARLWGDQSQFPYATDFCVLTTTMRKPLYCSEPIPEDIAATVTAPTRAAGTLNWSRDHEDHLSAYWELFTESALDAPPFRIIASQPEAVALEAVVAFRNVYAPGLLVTIGFTLLASGLYARRTLSPLSRLLDITKRFGNRDFTVKAELGREDEFQDLANALNGMAAELGREFKARESLSRIDRLILAGESEEEIARAALIQVLAVTPVERTDLYLFDHDSLNTAVRYGRARDGERVEKDSVIVSHACQTLLAARNDVWVLEPPLDDQRLQPFADGADGPFLLYPIRNQAQLRGALRCMGTKAFTADALAGQHILDLIDRIAVAIEHSDKNAKLHRQAFFDELTGLPNRQSCFLELDKAIRVARGSNRRLALMFIDLDGFKAVNDTLGHVIGDELLCQAASRITSCIEGSGGFTARLGGDEFAAVVPFERARPSFTDVSEQILEQLRAPFWLGNTEVNIGASIGTARYPEDGSDHNELLRKADAAMYRAKESGRGQRIDYSQTIGFAIARRLRLEIDLKHALERDELSIAYQPQLDLRTGRIASAEALVRWQHSSEGLISPTEFIPIAEETGYIITLGNWILYHACKQLRAWQADGLAIERIAVNVSARQLRNREFVQRVEDCVREFGLSPGELEIELTESIIINNREAERQLNALKDLGASISIDDFGTGFSSLGYLQKLVFDIVKVDRAFVQGLPDDRDGAAIVNAVVAMCHTLGKSVVAEGIETRAQLKHLADAGVDVGQGHYLGKPIPADEFLRVYAIPDLDATMKIRRIANTRALGSP